MGFHTAGEVRASLQFEAARCMDSIRNENAAYYKALCYLEISEQDDFVLEDLLSTVTDTYEALAATLWQKRTSGMYLIFKVYILDQWLKKYKIKQAF